MTPQLRFPEFTDKWQIKKLGDTVKFEQGVQVDLSQQKPTPFEDSVKFLRIENYTQKSQDFRYISKKIAGKKYINDDEVAVVRYGATAGFIATGQSGVLANNLFSVRSNGDSISNKFLSLRLKQPRTYSYFQSEMSGGAMPALSFSIVSRYKFAFPSKPEQEKIADFLTAVDERIAVSEKKLELLETYKRGVMQKIFTQQIRFKDESGKLYPEWEEKTLGDIGEVVTGKTPSTSDASKWNGDILFVTPTDIKNEKYQYTSERTVSASAVSKVLPTKSIMYTCIASIGKMSLSTRQTTTNQQINSLIPHKSYDNEFVYYGLLWLTPKIISTQSNNTLPIINKTEFSKFKLSTPRYGEQQKIATFLTALDDKIKVEQTRLNSAKQWKKGLLHRMFV